MSGFSAVIGSWKIIAIREPRRLRICSDFNCGKLVGRPFPLLNQMSPVTAAFGGSSPMMASEVTDFPEPDSPTSPRTSPAEIVKLRSRTATASAAVAFEWGVRALAKRTVRLRKSSNGATRLWYQRQGEAQGWACYAWAEYKLLSQFPKCLIPLRRQLLPIGLIASSDPDSWLPRVERRWPYACLPAARRSCFDRDSEENYARHQRTTSKKSNRFTFIVGSRIRDSRARPGTHDHSSNGQGNRTQLGRIVNVNV